MKRGVRLILPAIALVLIVLSVQGALKPKSASADWPPYGQGNCIQYGLQTTWQWRYFNYHWQIVPVTQQVCVQYSYVQPQFYSPYYLPYCSTYFYFNQCRLAINYRNCSQAYVDPWGNRFTCFGVEWAH